MIPQHPTESEMTDDRAREIVGPCDRCDDSGYVEFVSGGFWTGEGLRFRREICGCPCGDDVRREMSRILQEQER